jgi:hypothetical protein
MPKAISIRKFSTLVGVSHTAVNKAIKSGRLLRSVVVGPTGEVVGVDPETGVQEWAENSPDVVSTSTKALNDEDLPLPAGLSYADARAVREVYQARLAKLLYEEKMGRLVDSKMVEEQAGDMARLLRQAILNVPLKYAHELFAAPDVNAHTEIHTKALIEALEQVANERSLDR